MKNDEDIGVYPDDPEKNKINESHFFKSIAFQVIFDKDFDRDERDLLLVLFRQTLHFNKVWDRLPICELSEKSGIGERKTKETLVRLESKALIDVVHSKGGRSSSRKRFNAYRMSAYLFDDFFKKHNQATRDHDEWEHIDSTNVSDR